MSTIFFGTGNIGANPEFKEFANGNEKPRRLLRLNVYFDNPIPVKEGGYQDHGGYWAPVELWHQSAEEWSQLFQKGMRVMVQGRQVCQEWEDKKTGDKRMTFKVEARDIGILPHRIVEVVLESKAQDDNEGQQQDELPMTPPD